MKLSVTFNNINRSAQEVERLELTFRNAVLDYCPSVERLALFKRKQHYEYGLAVLRGKWMVGRLLTVKERLRLEVHTEFTND